MSQSPIPNPHDSFFKQTFARVEVTRDAIERFLPGEIVECLRLETLSPVKDSFVDDDLRQTFSDLVFEVETISGRPAMACVLLEHKSECDEGTAFQVLKYTIRINEQRLRAGLRLCCVIPLVVYHGPKRWTAPLDVHDLIDCPPALARFVPRFRYELLDLGSYGDEVFRGDPFVHATLLTLKYISRPELSEKLQRIVELVYLLMSRPEGRNEVIGFLRYLTVGTMEVDSETLSMAVKHSFQSDGESIMSSVAEKWVNQGIEKGIEQGIDLGEVIGQIRAFQEVLGLDVELREQLEVMASDKLQVKLSQLRQLLSR